jgi:hypothetical protein
VAAYARDERAAIDAARQRLRAVKASGTATAVWGMATKGIMFSLLVDPDSTLIDFAVDINANKQGCFVPMTGRAIEAPHALRRAGGRPVAIVVMNMNYLAEIRSGCEQLGITASLFDATVTEVSAV